MGEAGKSRAGQGGRYRGYGRKWKKRGGGSPEKGMASGQRTTMRGWKRGDAEGGPSEGEEKREFKLLTLLVFFK